MTRSSDTSLIHAGSRAGAVVTTVSSAGRMGGTGSTSCGVDGFETETVGGGEGSGGSGSVGRGTGGTESVGGRADGAARFSGAGRSMGPSWLGPSRGEVIGGGSGSSPSLPNRSCSPSARARLAARAAIGRSRSRRAVLPALSPGGAFGARRPGAPRPRVPTRGRPRRFRPRHLPGAGLRGFRGVIGGRAGTRHRSADVAPGVWPARQAGLHRHGGQGPIRSLGRSWASSGLGTAVAALAKRVELAAGP